MKDQVSITQLHSKHALCINGHGGVLRLLPEAREQFWLQLTCFIVQIDRQLESQNPTRYQGTQPGSQIEEISVQGWDSSSSIKIEVTPVSNHSD